MCLEVHCNDGSDYELRVDRKIPLYRYPTNETYFKLNLIKNLNKK